MDEKDKRIKTLENLLQTTEEAEERAVAAYLPYKKENERLRAENDILHSRNAVLESALGDMSDAARAVLAIEPAT